MHEDIFFGVISVYETIAVSNIKPFYSAGNRSFQDDLRVNFRNFNRITSCSFDFDFSVFRFDFRFARHIWYFINGF